MRRVVGVALIAALAATGEAWAKLPEIVIDPVGVPPAALQVIHTAVGAISRLAEDQDGGEIQRLRRRARDATLSALATQGFFTPTVTLEAGTDIGGETWEIAIDAGKRSMVSSVDLSFSGRITREEFAARVEALRNNWLLPVGRPFINSEWNRAKSNLLDSVSSRDFLLARMTASQAEVLAEQAKVNLSVSIDSGPLVRLGPLVVEGLERVPESLVRRYIRYDEGRAFNQDLLDQWQQELQSTAFFRGVFVTLQQTGPAMATLPEAPPEQRPGHPTMAVSSTPVVSAPAGDPAVSGAMPPLPPTYDSDGVVTLPVLVRVVEAPPKRLAMSLGVDDEAGVRVETVYRQNVVFGQPLTMETGVGVDRLRQRAYADFLLPPDARGNKDSIGLLASHYDVEGLDVRRFALGATRLQERHGAGDSRVDYETRWGLLLAHDHVQIDRGDSYDLPSATATVEWLRRDVDNKYDPREGNLLAVGGGVGVVLDTGKPYTRARLRAQKWWPVGKLDVLTVRGEVGRIWSDGDTQVPDDFGFRTGGARTIRGYRYLSIGQQRNGAIVGAATLAVASVEYDHYFDDRWGMAVFVDAGDAASSFGAMDIAVGYGVGARVRTPAGPLAMDVAYGQRDNSLRLHFSLGIAF